MTPAVSGQSRREDAHRKKVEAEMTNSTAALLEPGRENAQHLPRRSTQRTFAYILNKGVKQKHSQTPETTAGYRREVVISRLIEAFCGFKLY